MQDNNVHRGLWQYDKDSMGGNENKDEATAAAPAKGGAGGGGGGAKAARISLGKQAIVIA